MNIFFISEKRCIHEKFRRIIHNKAAKWLVHYYFSESDRESWKEFSGAGNNGMTAQPVCLRNKNDDFFKQYDLFFSWHCRQIFPADLVENYRCINLHPSLNPYNRGWYPQVFCIYNGMPAGVTIHDMDAEIDRGHIICQLEVEKKLSDTAFELYGRISSAEEKLVEDSIVSIVNGTYEKKESGKGNINYRSDFEKLCEINLDKQATYREVINYLRAMTFGDYHNAYFYDNDGKKIWIKVHLEKEI